MSYSNLPCKKCGTTGQGNVEFNSDDNQWVFHCWLCGQETPIPDNQIPARLQSQKYRYAEHVLKSNGVPQGNFPHYLTKNNDDSNWRLG